MTEPHLADPSVTAGATRDTLWTLVAYVTRALGSLAFVVAASRALGASRFGGLAALSSLTSLGVALIVSGVSRAVTQTAAQRTDDARATVAAATRGIHLASTALVVPFALLASLLPNVTVRAAVCLFVVDVALTGATEAAASRFVGEARFTIATALLTPMAIGRIVAAGIVTVGDIHTIDAVCLVALLCGMAGFAVCWFVNRAHRGPGDGTHVTVRTIARRGGVYTTGNLVNRASNDLDKVYLSARLGADPHVGSYAIAYRIAEYAAIPMTALSAAAAPRLFHAGASGDTSAHTAARALRTRYLMTGVLTSLTILACAPLAHLVFGDSYTGLTRIVLALAPLPLLRSYSLNLAEPLTGANRHSRRVLVWTLGLVTNAVLNIALVPSHGIAGAIVATYATEVVQIIAFAHQRRALTRPSTPLPAG